MKVFVTGATGVMGRSVVRTLLAAGHRVLGLARNDTKAALLLAAGAEPVRARLFDEEGLARAFEGCRVVCNMATHVPVGYAGLRPGAWKANDRIRTEGSRLIVAAARRAGVRRVIQESVSLLYADAGEEWVTERSPIAVSRSIESAALAESNAERLGEAATEWVVLRFGAIIGDDAFTRWRLARARAGHSVVVGDPTSWTHVVHADDVGSSVLGALSAPCGIYNVGAQPVQRQVLADAFGQASGHPHGAFMPRLLQRVVGERVEPLTRSQRVSSAALEQAAAWKPIHPHLEPSWISDLAAVSPSGGASR